MVVLRLVPVPVVLKQNNNKKTTRAAQDPSPCHVATPSCYRHRHRHRHHPYCSFLSCSSLSYA